MKIQMNGVYYDVNALGPATATQPSTYCAQSLGRDNLSVLLPKRMYGVPAASRWRLFRLCISPYFRMTVMIA